MGGSNREVSIVTKAIIMVSFIWASPLSLFFFFLKALYVLLSEQQEGSAIDGLCLLWWQKVGVCELLLGPQG